MIQTHWYAITGAPSSGKTTLINAIADLGYKTAPEIAREYIEKRLSEALSLDDIKKNANQMQRDILAISLKRERHLNKDELIFFDRGTPDSLAYFKYYNLNSHTLEHDCQHRRYQKVFYCHPLPLVKDNVRVENNQSAHSIGTLLMEAYVHLGYTLIELPPISTQERLQIILSEL
jgi:predicted ATPase